jgi:hypothetical protein
VSDDPERERLVRAVEEAERQLAAARKAYIEARANFYRHVDARQPRGGEEQE